MSPALNYKALLYATPTHLPSICPFTRPHVIISALSMHLPPVLWAWIRAPATHFLGARILTTLPLSIPPAAFSALPQHLPSPFSVIILSSQYLFQRGPIWFCMKEYIFIQVPLIFALMQHSQSGTSGVPSLFAYRITPHTTHTFILCRTYVKEGVRVINGYINQNIFTAIL